MTKPIKTLLYIFAVGLFVAIPVIIRQAAPDRAKPPPVVLPSGLPDTLSQGPDAPLGFPADTVSEPARGNVHNLPPDVSVPSGPGAGPPEEARLRAARGPVPLDEIVYGAVRRLLAEDGRDAAAYAKGMLVSEDVRARAMGAVALLTSSGGDFSTLAPHLPPEDVSTALWAAGWLYDRGQGAIADGLVAQLATQDLSTADVHALLESKTVGGSAGRAALRLLSNMADEQILEREYVRVTQQDELPYSVRMMATVFLGQALEPIDHLYRVRGLANQASSAIRPAKSGKAESPPGLGSEDMPVEPSTPDAAETTPVDPLWVTGLMKLAADLKASGPATHAPLSRIGPVDIPRASAWQSPHVLEDLALRLEYLVGLENPTVYAGTPAALAALVSQLPETPTTESFGITRARLVALGKVLESLEDPNLSEEKVPSGVNVP